MEAREESTGGDDGSSREEEKRRREAMPVPVVLTLTMSVLAIVQFTRGLRK